MIHKIMWNLLYASRSARVEPDHERVGRASLQVPANPCGQRLGRLLGRLPAYQHAPLRRLAVAEHDLRAAVAPLHRGLQTLRVAPVNKRADLHRELTRGL